MLRAWKRGGWAPETPMEDLEGVVGSDGPVPSFGPMRGAHAEFGSSQICGRRQHHSGDHPACLGLSLTSCRLLIDQ